MSTCTILANAAHWLMLIIPRSNYLQFPWWSSFFFFLFSFCSCSVVFNDAGCKAWTTSWPFECFQRIHQRVCYYLSPSFPWFSRTYLVLLNKRMGKRRMLLCFCPLTCCALKQIGCGTLPVAPVLTSASTGPLAECASVGTAGTSIFAIAQLEWDCLSNCSRARMDLIYFLLYSSERERPDLPSGLIPTPRAWITCRFHSEEIEAGTQTNS